MTDLTEIEKIIQNINREEVDMKGVIRPISRERHCPTCKKKFVRSHERGNEGYVCPSGCGHKPKKFYIDLWWKNINYFLCSDKSGQPLDSYQRAKTLLSIINAEIQNHAFNPQSYTKAEIEKYFFTNILGNWIEGKEKEKEKGKIAPGTLRPYKIYVTKYYLPFFKNTDVREIRTVDIKRFYQGLPNNLSLKYQKCIMDTLHSIFNSLAEDDVILKKPSFKATRVTVPEVAPQWIDRETQDIIIGNIEDERDKPIYIYLTRQGNRPSEARALKIKDLDLREGTVTVSRTYSDHELVERNKEKKVKPRLINPELLPMLKRICKNRFPEEFVFINWRTGRPYNRNIFNDIWNEACKKAGITIRLYAGTKHSLGSQAARANVPESDIQKIFNHADIRSTKKYINKNELETQRAVFEKTNKVTKIRRKKN